MRVWRIVLAYFCGVGAWYAVQVHQTKCLTEIGFNAAGFSRRANVQPF